jgi:hypothetical protein
MHRYLVRYVKKLHHIGLKIYSDASKGFECFCDADFSGNLIQDFAAGRSRPSTPG